MSEGESNTPIKYLSEDTQTLCQRCKIEKAILISRKEHFCHNCFIRFIRGKQRKQMLDDRYKVRYGPAAEKFGTQKVLLALSGGVSSLVLLDVMSSLLQEQYKSHKGKQGFELVILNVDEFDLEALDRHVNDILPQLVSRYAPIEVDYKVLSLESYIIDQNMLQKVLLSKDFTALQSSIELDKEYTVTDILKLCPNKSSVEDLLTIMYDELILRTAYLEGCETIIYGHSMTRIANEIIALTVKGRGSNIYQAISDHTVHFRGKEFSILFPLRDVLYAEVVAYANLEDLKEFEVKSTVVKSKITKNLTIRDLTTNYFSQLDATGYASTASTVVKTGEKLGAPQVSHEMGSCQICGVYIYQDAKEWLRRITVNDAAPVETEEEKEYVELYKETFGNPEEADVTNSKPVNICYGCIVTLGGVKQDTGFVWPVKNKEEDGERPLSNIYSFNKQDILDEYILTDDEDEEGEVVDGQHI
ncbi:cytoplasmic tRNA 2-thiolation protein 2 [Scheffersomyces xylosifermentans]|uniref:cytoplasmic tRNA 2-thiolation protein 2 n=1 Tax=Scheffersomyces xylosifermentans TaxID=1304137 RepID=UPI00315D9A7D